jgi:hypothetical protein
MIMPKVQVVLSMYFEDEARQHDKLTSSIHVVAKSRLDAPSEYVLTVDDQDPQLTAFTLGQEPGTFVPGKEVSYHVSRIGIDNPGVDDIGQLFNIVSGAAADDIHIANHPS